MRSVDQVPTSRDWDVIIQRAQRMDASAFDTVVDAYAGRLCGFFRRLLGPNADAEDLTQEVFLRVVANIKSYEEQGRFEAYTLDDFDTSLTELSDDLDHLVADGTLFEWDSDFPGDWLGLKDAAVDDG